MLVIRSNGWADEHKTIADLLAVLESRTLDPIFEGYGNFIEANPTNCNGLPLYPDNPGVVSFFGNFYNLAHVFSIYTDETETIATLTAAIRRNQQKPEYAEAKRHQAEHAKLERKAELLRMAEAYRRNAGYEQRAQDSIAEAERLEAEAAAL
jgi:hypothetical protein